MHDLFHLALLERISRCGNVAVAVVEDPENAVPLADVIIYGDYNDVSAEEVAALAKGNASGRVSR